MDKRVAIYAESEEEMAFLREYVRRRGWTSSGHEYGPREWKDLVSDARRHIFESVKNITVNALKRSGRFSESWGEDNTHRWKLRKSRQPPAGQGEKGARGDGFAALVEAVAEALEKRGQR